MLSDLSAIKLISKYFPREFITENHNIQMKGFIIVPAVVAVVILVLDLSIIYVNEFNL